MKTRTTWRQKLEKDEGPSFVDDPKGMGKMLIPRPLDVDALIRKVPAGQVVTMTQLRDRLARDCYADVCCPLTSGIFVRIAAETAEEDRAAGRTDITPYWRVLKADGSLNEKFPGGPEAQAARLKAEGLATGPARGKKPPKVMDYEKHLASILMNEDTAPISFGEAVHLKRQGERTQRNCLERADNWRGTHA